MLLNHKWQFQEHLLPTVLKIVENVDNLNKYINS